LKRGLTPGQPAGCALWIVYIATMKGLPFATNHAKGRQALVYPVAAQIAFLSDLIVRIKSDGVIRTRVHAGFTAVTSLPVQEHNPVCTLLNGIHGTGIRTRRMLAVVADQRHEDHPEVGKRAHGHILGRSTLRPHPYKTDSSLILVFTGHRAGLAADAAFLIDN
jgi:hypothetical protein